MDEKTGSLIPLEILLLMDGPNVSIYFCRIRECLLCSLSLLFLGAFTRLETPS